jgi:hypothetical protein
MLHSKELDNATSPSNTYVVPIFTGKNYSRIKFRKFTLPEEYNAYGATWYFYNKLDYGACGGSAFPYEMYQDISE